MQYTVLSARLLSFYKIKFFSSSVYQIKNTFLESFKGLFDVKKCSTRKHILYAIFRNYFAQNQRQLKFFSPWMLGLIYVVIRMVDKGFVPHINTICFWITLEQWIWLWLEPGIFQHNWFKPLKLIHSHWGWFKSLKLFQATKPSQFVWIFHWIM